MSLILLDGPENYTAAFGINKINIETDDSNVTQLNYNLKISGTSLSDQYIPVYAVYSGGIVDSLESIIDVKALYSSVLSSYDNILNTTSNFEELDMSNHQAYIEDYIEEDIDSGDTMSINRYIFKAVELNNPSKWSSSRNYIPIQEDDNGDVYRKVYNGIKIPICQYTENVGAYSDVRLIESTGTTVIGQLKAGKNYRCAMWVVNTDEKLVQINVNNSSPSIKLIVDNKPYKYKKVLYFLNRYGGWDWFFANHYETREITSKKQYTKYENIEGELEVLQLTQGTIIEQKLYTDPLNSDAYEYLKDMINSPIILDDKGVRVRIIDNTISYNFKGLIDPVFTIQYIEKENIIY